MGAKHPAGVRPAPVVNGAFEVGSSDKPAATVVDAGVVTLGADKTRVRLLSKGSCTQAPIYFTFTANATTSLRFSAFSQDFSGACTSASDAPYAFDILDANLALVSSSNPTGNGCPELVAPALSSGRYFVRVNPQASKSAYALELEVMP